MSTAGGSFNKRHGFHLTCQTCKCKSVIGGIEDPKQFSKIIKDYKHQHQNHDYTLKQSYHAAELGHASQVANATRQSVATSTYNDVTGASIAASSFVANKKYLISVTATVDSNSTTNGTKVRVVRGTTPTAFADSEAILTPTVVTTDRQTYQWFTVYTQPATAELVKVQVANFSTSTSGIDQVTIVAIKLSDDLVEGTDWNFTETTATVSLTTGDSSTSNAALTFTPATANQKWLVMSKSRLDAAGTTRGVGSRIVGSGGVTTTTPFCQFECQSANDFYIWTLARVFTLAASSHTFTEKSFSTVANANSRVHSGIFYMNLSKLAVVADSYDDSTPAQMTATAYGDTVRTVSITPSVAGNVWVYGFFSVDQNATAITHKGRIQVDNSTSTEFPANVTTDNYTLWGAHDATDETPFNAQGMINLTAAAHTVDLDGSVSASVAARGSRCESLFAVTMELPAPPPIVKDKAESIDFTEQVARVRAARNNAVYHMAAASNGTTFTQSSVATRNNTRFGMTGVSQSSTESQMQMNVRTAGTVSKMQIYVSSNNATGGGTWYFRKNGADTSLTLAITPSTTGRFLDTTNTVSVAAGDLVNYNAIRGSGTGLFELSVWGALFSHNTATKDMTITTTGGNISVASASNTSSMPLIADTSVTDAVTHRYTYRVKDGAVAKNFMLNISANARTTATTFVVRKNAANGAGTISVGAATTGILEDTTNTDTLAVGDTVNIHRTTGTGSEAMTVTLVKLEFEHTQTTSTPASFLAAANASGSTHNANGTYYAPLTGLMKISVTSATNLQTRAIQPLADVGALQANIQTNNITAASTLSLNKNNSTDILSLSIGASTSGTLLSTDPDVKIEQDADTLAYKIVTGATGTNFEIRFISVNQAAGIIDLAGFIPPKVINESVELTEDRNSLTGIPTYIQHSRAFIDHYHSVQTGANEFSAWGIGALDFTSAETTTLTRIRTGGSISHLQAKVLPANTRTEAATLYIRTAPAGSSTATDTNLSVSIPATTTGHFSETSRTVSVGAGMGVNYHIVSIFSGSGNANLSGVSSTFLHADSRLSDTNIKSLAVVTGPFGNIILDNSTFYGGIVGGGTVGGDADWFKFKNRIPSSTGGTITVKNMQAYVGANNRTSTTTIKSRKNSTDGNLSISIGAAVTGHLEDTSNTDSIAENDKISYSVTSGAGAGGGESIGGDMLKLELEESVAKTAVRPVSGDATATIQNYGALRASASEEYLLQSTTAYFTLTGYAASTTYDFTIDQVATQTIPPMGTIYSFQAYVSWNDLNGGTNSTITLMKNGAEETSQQLSVAPGATGEYVDSTPNLYSALNTTANTDKLAYKIVVGTPASGTGQLFAISQTSLITGPLAPPPAPPAAILKQVDESVTLTEAINLVRGRIQNISEAIDISENIARIAGKIRNINESLIISEAVNRLANLNRVVNENIAYTEARNHIKNMTRIANESVNFTEAVNRIKNMTQNVNESINIAETLNSVLGRIQTVNESVSITEAVNVISGKVRVVNENVAFTEALNYLMNKIRVINEAVSISESINIIRNLSRVINESTNITEAVNHVRGRLQQISENINITEAVNRIANLVRIPPNEAVSFTEAINQITGKVRVVNEAVQFTEALNRISNLSRVVNESVEITETINRLSNRVKTINENISIGEAHNITRNLLRVYNEQIEVTEALNRISGLNRVVNESVDILEQAQRNLSLTRVVNETVELTEAINRVIGKIRVINESLDITELVNSVVTPVEEQIKQTVNEAINISEAVNTILGLGITRVVNENVSFSEATPIFLRGLNRIVNESVEFTEALNRLANYVRTVNESVHITEAHERLENIIRHINEAVDITEATQYIKALTQVVNETLNLTESQISATGRVKVVSEVIEITEQILSKIEEFTAFPIIGQPTASPFHFPHIKYRTKARLGKLEQLEEVKPKTTVELPMRVIRFRYQVAGAPESPKKFKVSNVIRIVYSIHQPITRRNLEINAIADRLASNWLIQRARTIRAKSTQIEKKSASDVIILKQPVSKRVSFKYQRYASVSKILHAKYCTKQSVSKSLRASYQVRTLLSKKLICGYQIKSAKDYRELSDIRQLLELKDALEMIGSV